ncbi:MAG: hypothetical protein K6F10_04435 [Paludibacteraceae bacterium]|nr:hypothetical protein [Paludibacteraceae bacterium]
MKKTLVFIGIVFAALVVVWGYKDEAKSKEAVSRPEDGEPVFISKKLFFNPDSLNYYAAIAYKDDDPKGLFVTGMTYYLKESYSEFIPGYPTPNKEDADIMILHSADLGYPDAIQFIHCMAKNGCWDYCMPEDKVTLGYREIINDHGTE